MKRFFLVVGIGITLLTLTGCATISKESVKFDKEFHQGILNVARIRVQYVSCDIGLIDGLGLGSVAIFPIKTAGEARTLLTNPEISIALSEMKDETIKAGAWREEDYRKCKVLGLGYRSAALSAFDILKLFPSLAPYLKFLGM